MKNTRYKLKFKQKKDIVKQEDNEVFQFFFSFLKKCIDEDELLNEKIKKVDVHYNDPSVFCGILSIGKKFFQTNVAKFWFEPKENKETLAIHYSDFSKQKIVACYNSTYEVDMSDDKFIEKSREKLKEIIKDAELNGEEAFKKEKKFEKEWIKENIERTKRENTEACGNGSRPDSKSGALL